MLAWKTLVTDVFGEMSVIKKVKFLESDEDGFLGKNGNFGERFLCLGRKENKNLAGNRIVLPVPIFCFSKDA